MKRRLFSLLSALSLLMAVAVTVLWVRSHWVIDRYTWSTRHSSRTAWTSGGRLYVSSVFWKVDREIQLGYPTGYSKESRTPSDSRLTLAPEVRTFMGIAKARSEFGGVSSEDLLIPLTLIFALSLAVPVTQILIGLRTRAKLPGLCPACGYDLRATPRRCPECGREAGAEKVTAPS